MPAAAASRLKSASQLEKPSAFRPHCAARAGGAELTAPAARMHETRNADFHFRRRPNCMCKTLEYWRPVRAPRELDPPRAASPSAPRRDRPAFCGPLSSASNGARRGPDESREGRAVPSDIRPIARRDGSRRRGLCVHRGRTRHRPERLAHRAMRKGRASPLPQARPGRKQAPAQ
jgi:hypothetical protein